jgi:predicted ATP-binding protein involved in virulence
MYISKTIWLSLDWNKLNCLFIKMRIKKIQIQNFRGIEDITFEFPKKLSVFVGKNGSGKSSILDAIAISLSWLVNRIQRENSSGKPIIDSSIKNDTPFSSIKIEVLEARKTFKWRIAKTQKGFNVLEKSELSEVSELANYLQQTVRDTNILPVIAYYPINRLVSNTSTELASKDSFNTLDVYDNALGGKTNYQSFFDWFRLQDDIVNERANSRSKWMINNKLWVKAKINKILKSLIQLTKFDNDNDIEFIERFTRRFKRDNFIYEEPRYLFLELSEILNFTRYSNRDNKEYDEIFHELEYLLHKMSSLSDSNRDNLIEMNEYPFKVIEQISRQIFDSFYLKNSTIKKMPVYIFIWDALLFSVLISLWWTSDKCKKEIENLFREHNPLKIKNLSFENIEVFIFAIRKTVKDDIDRFDKATKNDGREIYFVTKAIEDFIPEYTNLRISRVPRPQMFVDKNGDTISLDQLSDGEKNLIALVGDIARRLSIANSNSRNPLTGYGIILIDEIDLHLHPAWQRLMIPRLTYLFPNCQFLITTHSPQVISHAMPESIFLLNSIKGKFFFNNATESFGKNTDRILEDLLDVDARPLEQKKMIHSLYTLIQQGDISAAKEEINVLLALIGEDPEIIKAQTLIKRKEIIGK